MKRPNVSPRRSLVIVAYIAVGIGLFTPPYASTHVWARMAPAFAVVDHGTLAIDAIIADPDRVTEDVSLAGGRVYSNKAPGLLLVAVPVYAALSAAPIDRDRAYVIATWLTQVLGAVLPTAIFLLLLHALLVERYRLEVRRATLLVWGVAFGTLALPYSIALFGHQTAAALVGIAVALTLRDMERHGRVRSPTAFPAALFLGLATATDYLAAIPAVGWTVWLWTAGRPDRSAVLAWVGAAAIPAAALGAYHWACFGAPWRLPYAEGILDPVFTPDLGWHWPDPGTLWALTLGPRRGLVYANPIWLGAAAGVWAAARRGAPSEWRAATGIVATMLLVLASWDSWHGGWAVGPRYLVSALPLAALLLVEGFRRAPRAMAVLTAVSGAGMLLVAVAGPVVPPDRADPFWSWALPRLVADAGLTSTPADTPATSTPWLAFTAMCVFGSLILSTLHIPRPAPDRAGRAPRGAVHHEETRVG